MHMGDCNYNNCVDFHTVNKHIGKLSGQAAPQAGCNHSATVRKYTYPLQVGLDFRQEPPPKTILFHFVPINSVIKFIPGRLKETDIHGLYFSKTSAAETELISPAL